MTLGRQHAYHYWLVSLEHYAPTGHLLTLEGRCYNGVEGGRIELVVEVRRLGLVVGRLQGRVKQMLLLNRTHALFTVCGQQVELNIRVTI